MLSNRWLSSSVVSRISHLYHGLIPAQAGGGGDNEGYILHTMQLEHSCIVFTNNLHLFMSHSLMCVFLYWLLHNHQCHVLYYFLFFSMRFTFIVLVHCCTDMTYYAYCCVISVIVTY
jgi:hypothetical protein